MNLNSKRFLLVFVALLLCTFAFSFSVEQVKAQRSQFEAPIMIVNTSFLNVRTGPGAQYSVLLTLVGGAELPVLGVAPDRVWYQVSTTAGVGWINSTFVLPRGNFGNVPEITLAQALEAAARITFDEADDALGSTDSFAGSSFSGGREWGISIIIDHPIRPNPNTEAGEIGYTVSNRSVIYEVLQANFNQGQNWYLVRIPGQPAGWVEGSKTMFRPFACNYTAVMFNADVTPRTGPDGSGTFDGNITIPGGSEAYLLDNVNGFYKIEVLDGNTGWVNSSAAVVREGVTSDFCTSGSIRPTTTADGTSATPRVPRAGSLATATIIINTGFLNIRSGPGAQYTIAATLPGGTEVTPLGIAPDGVWYLVEGLFGRGWMNIEFGLFRGNGGNLPIIRDATGSILARPTASITDAVNLYAAPNTTLGLIGALSGPLEVDVVARTSDFEWVQLSSGIGFGWVMADLVTLNGDTSLVPVVGN